MSVNKAIILGRLGSDPELTYTPSGTANCKIGVATSKKFKDKSGEKKERTDWHNLVFWGKKAEIFQQYVRKGDMIYVEGELQTQTWEKDGHKNYKTEIVVDVMQFVDKVRKEPKQNQSQENPSHDYYDNGPGF